MHSDLLADYCCSDIEVIVVVAVEVVVVLLGGIGPLECMRIAEQAPSKQQERTTTHELRGRLVHFKQAIA